MSYDSAGNAFTGTVENTITNILINVRIEVHLSSGSELAQTALWTGSFRLQPGGRRPMPALAKVTPTREGCTCDRPQCGYSLRILMDERTA